MTLQDIDSLNKGIILGSSQIPKSRDCHVLDVRYIEPYGVTRKEDVSIRRQNFCVICHKFQPKVPETLVDVFW